MKEAAKEAEKEAEYASEVEKKKADFASKEADASQGELPEKQPGPD